MDKGNDIFLSPCHVLGNVPLNNNDSKNNNDDDSKNNLFLMNACSVYTLSHLILSSTLQHILFIL